MSIQSHEYDEMSLPPKRELSCESNMLEDAQRQKTEQNIKTEDLIETQECKIPDKSLVNANDNLTKNLFQDEDIDFLREHEKPQLPTTSVACSKNDSPIIMEKVFKVAVYGLVQKSNEHKCSFTCKSKFRDNCRFGFG